MTQLGVALRSIGAGAQSMEEVAERTVNLLYHDLADSTLQTKACALVRFFLATECRNLTAELRDFGARLMHQEPPPGTRCLTLLATLGENPAWQSRKTSNAHQAIPLPSADVIQKFPMISQLVMQLGLPVAAVVTPDPALMLELEQRSYNVFFVPEAAGSPYIPAQDDFVLPYQIHSVLGFGGLLPSGDVYGVLMFMRIVLPKAIADMFRNAAMNLKLALLPVLSQPVFRES